MGGKKHNIKEASFPRDGTPVDEGTPCSDGFLGLFSIGLIRSRKGNGGGGGLLGGHGSSVMDRTRVCVL